MKCEVMPIGKTATASHLGWRGDDRYVVYCYEHSQIVKNYSAAVKSQKKSAKLLIGFVRNIVKKLLPSNMVQVVKGSAFYVMVDAQYNNTVRMPISHLPTDGHPSFTEDGRFMLTDTYADKDGYRHLLIYDTQKGSVKKLGKFYSPFNCCGYRADLHPRFSRDEKRVIIDSAHTGQHQIYVFDINWDRV